MYEENRKRERRCKEIHAERADKGGAFEASAVLKKTISRYEKIFSSATATESRVCRLN
jgi:hypothetical protein